jgi:mono/diheme cytochrome c family protein
MSVTKIFSFFLDLFVILFFTGLVLNVRGQELPTNSSTLFSGSGNCAACHAPGVMNPNALLNSRNQDISPTTLWRSTMMGNGAKDPLWQAKVKAEVAANPHLKEIIEDKCTTCHGPMGRTEAHFNGSSYYSLEELQDDSLALDGVSCTVCHQIKDDALGASGSFSGGYKI